MATEQDLQTVIAYDDGSTLEGKPSPELVRESAMAGDTGAVSAYRDEAGVWQYVADCEVEHYERHLRTRCVTVWVQS